MEQRKNIYDVFATLAGVYRFPGDSNRTLLHKLIKINKKGHYPSTEFIANYISKHFDKDVTVNENIYIHVLDKSPIYRLASGEFADINLKYYTNDIPLYRMRNVHNINELPVYDNTVNGCIVFPETDRILSKIIIFTDRVEPGTYRLTYLTEDGPYTEIINISTASIDGDFSVYDLALEPSDTFIDDIVPSEDAIFLEDFLDKISPKTWGHSSIPMAVSPRNLGMTFPSRLDANINNSEALSTPMYNGPSKFFKTGEEYGSFEIMDRKYHGNALELKIRPGVINYRNIKIFIGKKDIIHKAPYESEFTINIKDGFPIDIIKLGDTGTRNIISIPECFFFAADEYDVTMCLDATEMTDEEKVNALSVYYVDGIIALINYLMTLDYFVSSDLGFTIPSYISDSMSVSDASLITNGLNTVGVPLTSSIMTLQDYTLSTENDKLKITLTDDDDIANELTYIVCKPDIYTTMIPIPIIYGSLIETLSIGVGFNSEELRDMYCTITSNTIDDIKLMIIPISQSGHTYMGHDFDISCYVPGIGDLDIIDNISTSSSTFLTTRTNQYGVIEIKILDDLPVGSEINVIVDTITKKLIF